MAYRRHQLAGLTGEAYDEALYEVQQDEREAEYEYEADNDDND